jgi:hypothetical protein
MKRGAILILELFFIIFFIHQASASFTTGNLSNSINDVYELGSTITGWANISLNNEPTNSVLKDSLGESINLIDLLKKTSNLNFVYTCNPASCASDYAISNGAVSKTITLNENSSFLGGLNISTDSRNLLSSVILFSFNISSNNPETEKTPLMIDILNDGKIEWQSHISSGNFADSENLGCFGAATSQANLISTAPYCERIELTRAPGIEIGAYVNGSNTASFNMKIQRVGDELQTGSCTSSVSGNSGVKRVGCIPPGFSIKEAGDYFVCINPSTLSDANKGYTISYEQTNPCGFTGTYN